MALNRWLSILALLVILLIAGGWLTWYFAYGIGEEPPAQAVVDGLSGPVRIGWHDEGYATVQAETEQDALTGLGYAQGIRRAWMMLLLRQAALGRQGEWFGDALLPADRLARRLAFAALAEAAYDSLAEENKQLLAAYTRGVNAALQSRTVRLSDELAMLRLEPEPWEPWHTLAVERLFAWLAAPPLPPDSLANVGADARAFFRADALLRDWLHLHGFEHSIAWALRDSTGTQFFQRHVYGNSALPFYFEAVLEWPGVRLMGGSLPGTPFFPMGKTQDRAWALLPHGTFRFEYVADDTAATKHYERLRSLDGREELLTFRRGGPVLYFDPPPRTSPPPRPVPPTAPDTLAPTFGMGGDTMRTVAGDSLAALRPAPADSLAPVPDSTWALRWPGFQSGSDLDVWRSLPAGGGAAFRLLQATGLTVQPDGDWQVLGTPETVASLPNGIVVGNTPWVRYVARTLDSLMTAGEPSDPGALALDYHSIWAEELAPALVASVDSIPRKAPIVEEALTYLRNWNYTYDRASIAAPIFDTWVALYRDSIGTFPQAQTPDTVYFEDLLRYQILQLAVEQLRTTYGEDLSQWRWEAVYPNRWFFPVFSVDSLLDERLVLAAKDRFAPIALSGSGHPTAPAWGSSPILDERFHASAWAAWTHTANWDELRIRRRIFDVSSFLSRYRISERPPAPVVLSPDAEPDRTTLLTPAPV